MHFLKKDDSKNTISKYWMVIIPIFLIAFTFLVNNPHQRWGLLQPYKGFLYFSLD
jgi:hypothetical protein